MRLSRMTRKPWLKLPRPVGVFAANDSVAAGVIAACDHRHLSIPQEIAVLGVDNDESLCGYASWSSVHRLLCNENKLNN